MKKIVVLMYLLCFSIIAAMVSAPAYATNGMNLEGYGPIATGMGGASMAYDNGTAAVMNNPATLGLMPDGNRLDVAIGYLGPHIVSSAPGAPDAKSSADAFYMPAIGWAHKSGKMTYGLGMFAQGGMGTEYSADSFMAAGSGQEVRSEVSVGRLSVPFAYEVTKELTLAASVDYVWAGMDLKMAMSGAQFGDMVAALGGTQTYGTASGTMVDILAGAFSSGSLSQMNWARYDFSDNSDYTGKAQGQGFAGNIGGVYKVTDKLAVGATYHSKTSLGDLETDGATLSMNVSGSATGNQAATVPVTGKIQVKDFQWPQTIGAGLAYQASDKLMLVADYKWINWADVMRNFKMTFTADSTQADPSAAAFGLGGTTVDATLYQEWKNQNVFMVGGAYKATEALTVRAGLNVANNPIPNTYLNALFPAIEKNHVTLGAGYQLSMASSVDASFTYAPEVKETADSGVTTSHDQTNAQVMYSYRF
jgi:long-chain fatty acid transport protein